jgi:hypothetical protein
MEILSVDEVKRVFAKHGETISEEEARLIVDYLTEMAQIAVAQFLKNENS